MTEPQQHPYDELPYGSVAFAQSHPDRLAVLARLFGMEPAPVDRCRVLELGCASGGNLIPMAAQTPNASFLGIDLSARQIAEGRALIAELGLANIELRHLSIADIEASGGKFDYIIVHGVYSWVASEVQDKILSVCRQNLAEHGVAYISYNTNPGWRMRGMIRDVMLYHVKQFGTIAQKVQQARAVLDFLAQNVPTNDSAYGTLVKRESESLRSQADSYLAHEHLEGVNEPVYFHQFAERAATHGLQYLGEADFSTMLASNFPPGVAETLRKIAPDIIRMEQYMDFLRNRQFRQTLLVHQSVRLNRNLNWNSLDGYYVASAARPISASPDVATAAVEAFRAPNGATLNTPNSVVKAAMMILAERWPKGMPFADLCAAARGRLTSGPVAAPDRATTALDAQVLGADLLQCYTVAMVELRMGEPRFTTDVGDRPIASLLARLQAAKGPTVTNLRHEPTTLDEFNRHLLRLLDGSRDRAGLLEALAEIVRQKALKVQRQGEAVQDENAVRAILATAVNENLTKLAQAALLEG